MAVTLTNCTIQNNTNGTIRIVPNAPHQGFDVPANSSVPQVTTEFDTIEVGDNEELETAANTAAQGHTCIFNLVNDNYTLMVPPNSSAVFLPA